MATIARVKGWADFQHYRDRNPPWIKLHRKLLENFEFARLPLASKALAPLLWLLAAESDDGTVRIDFDWLAFRLHITELQAEEGVTPLIHWGFLEIASGVLAPCKRKASLETEAEAEREKPLARQAARFAEFWALYPVKKGRKAAEAKWKARNLDQIADHILDDVRNRAAKDRQWREGYIPHGSTYVNGSGWEDAIDETPTKLPLGANGRPEVACNPEGTSPKVAETPQRKLSAQVAFVNQQLEFGLMTKEQAAEHLKPYKEAVREAENGK